MQETGGDVLKILGAVLLALLVIGLAIGIYRHAKTGISDAEDQMTKMTTTMAEGEYTDYEGQIIPGSTVLSLCSQHANDAISMEIVNKGGTVYYNYANATSVSDLTGDKDATTGVRSGTVSMADLGDRTNTSAYVSPSAKYFVTLTRDTNNSEIVKMTFTQQ